MNNNISLPRGTKASLEDLSDLPIREFSVGEVNEQSASIYKLARYGFKFDFLWKPKPGAQRIFVFFSGDAQRSKRQPPVFQRWSWADKVPGHCLFVSDPSLHLAKDLGLAWYAGTKDFDPLPVIAETVGAIAAKLQLKRTNIYSYGSSGGGFAALRFGLFLPDAVLIAINPQITITKYHKGLVKRYIKNCWGSLDRETLRNNYPERFDLVESANVLRDRRIIYAQNIVDLHHFIEHYRPFCQAMGANPNSIESEGEFIRILFDYAPGHKGAETPEVFGTICEQAERWTTA